MVTRYLLFTCFMYSLIQANDVPVQITCAEQRLSCKISNEKVLALLEAVDGIYIQNAKAIVSLKAEAETESCFIPWIYKMTLTTNALDQKRNVSRDIIAKNGLHIRSNHFDVGYRGFKEYYSPFQKFNSFTIACSQINAFNQLKSTVTLS